jgi:hypothetical protein
MVLTAESRTTWREVCPSSTLSTTNLTGTDLRFNPELRDDRLATNHLSQGEARKRNLI